MTTLCDVIDNCIECPRYGDDCDGDKMTEHTDLISRADAIEAVGGVVMAEFDVAPTRGYDVAEKALSALPSADAVEVVRCKDCKWYQGVHGVQGHAPCEWLNKQVLWNGFCSNGEPYKGGDPE